MLENSFYRHDFAKFQFGVLLTSEYKKKTVVQANIQGAKLTVDHNNSTSRKPNCRNNSQILNKN